MIIIKGTKVKSPYEALRKMYLTQLQHAVKQKPMMCKEDGQKLPVAAEDRLGEIIWNQWYIKKTQFFDDTTEERDLLSHMCNLHKRDEKSMRDLLKVIVRLCQFTRLWYAGYLNLSLEQLDLYIDKFNSAKAYDDFMNLPEEQFEKSVATKIA